MRVLVLWKGLSGYSAACWRQLVAQGADVRILYRSPGHEAPFDEAELVGDLPAEGWIDEPSRDSVEHEFEHFRPDVVLVSSWDVAVYRRAAAGWGGRALRMLCMDNPWLGTPRQWAGRFAAPIMLHRSYDVAFVPGERQAEFARRLGFAERQILWGLYSCDEVFFDVEHRDERSGFVFVGRLVDDKGVTTLLEAYRLYRGCSKTPWPLAVAGVGPLASAVSAEPGVELVGFQSLAGLRALYERAGAFVLPSRFEPWGVVIHEACAAGLPVVASTACGATTSLVLDGYNGRVVEAGDASGLSDALHAIARLEPIERARLGRASRGLARQFTPTRWAAYVLDRSQELLPSYRNG